MLVEKLKFDASRDNREVDQFGYVDINDAIASGKLPLSVPASSQQFDAPAGTPLAPSQIGGVPADIFDAYEMRDSARAAVADANAKREAANAAASASTE